MKKTILLVVLMGLLCIAANNVFAQEEALSTVGVLGTSNIYITYVAIGAIADGHCYEVYDDDTAIELMQVFANLSSSSIESLQDLLDFGNLDSEDFSIVNEMISILNLLINEAQAYQQYIETYNDSCADRYENYRNSAWEKIEVLLGL